MNVIKLSLNQLITCLVTLCFLLTTLQPSLLLAQSTDDGLNSQSTDFEPPTILLNEETVGDGTEVQSFNALVTDNQGLSQVTLHFRFDDATNFTSQAMTTTGKPDEFSATVDTASASSTLYYYIEATDIAGNKTFKGHTFSPLERQLGAQTSEALSTSANQTDANEPAKKSNKLYWVLGAVALLALAGLAGGSGGDDGGGSPSQNCDAGGCVVNLQLTNP